MTVKLKHYPAVRLMDDDHPCFLLGTPSASGELLGAVVDSDLAHHMLRNTLNI
jgi:hypothetical protein